MATNKKQLKKLRHERRMAEQQRAKQEASFGLEQITQEWFEEMFTAVLADWNTHILAIVETDAPEALPLMGPDLLQTFKYFSDAGMTETLKQAMAQCKEELEALVGLTLLSWAKTDVPAEPS